MTKQQEKLYEFIRELGWEFSHWDGDKVIVELWKQDTMESRSLFATVEIDPDGNHKCIEDNVKEQEAKDGA